MPITPRFSLSQSGTHVHVDIRVPHVRVSTDSIQVALSSSSGDFKPPILGIGEQERENENDCLITTTLHFSSPPYILVLNFNPYEFHEMATESCASYEPTIENGTVRLSLRKKEAGLLWENLDLVGRMAQPKTISRQSAHTGQSLTSNWLKEVSTRNNPSDEESSAGKNVSSLPTSGSYGFMRMFNGIFADLNKDGLAREMLELQWDGESDDGMPCEEASLFARRRQERWRLEQERFDPDRWRQDINIYDDYVYQCALAMRPHWKMNPDPSTDDDISHKLADLELDEKKSEPFKTGVTQPRYFSEEEQLKLMGIPYPMLPTEMTMHHMDALLLGLWDILFAYVYDHLTTDGEPTVESSWTISTLSTSLSCLEEYSDAVMMQAERNEPIAAISLGVVSSFRRSLIYPYIRNLRFAEYCGKQVAEILEHGPRCIIRCLLQTRKILEESELYYLGNKLFLDPYLAWLQHDINQITDAIQKFRPVLLSCIGKIKRLSDLGLAKDESDDDSDGESSESFEESSQDEDESSTSSSQPSTGRPTVSDALLDHNLGKSCLSSIAKPIE